VIWNAATGVEVDDVAEVDRGGADGAEADVAPVAWLPALVVVLDDGTGVEASPQAARSSRPIPSTSARMRVTPPTYASAGAPGNNADALPRT
jgi:hypothetical protein